MKYNFTVDQLNQNTAQGKILAQIQPGSTVLECGCATGYMTHYMKEKLGCKVYVIEYEQEAFDIAKQYAEDGICTDLMKDDWIIKFQGMKFDYIIFADVLEHLYNPKMVLKNASKLIKYNGKILISLPNIGHNDVLLKLYENHWDYTPLGLLDNTHIRFWGDANLENFVSQANLEIVKKDYVFIQTLCTEQMMEGSYNKELFDMVVWRNGGDIYQFILTLQLSSYVQQEQVEKCYMSPGFKQSILYYTTKEYDQYNEKMCFYAKSPVGEYLNYRFEINIDTLQHLRFDPTELFGMVVKEIKITSNLGELSAKPNNAALLNNDVVFYDSDPSYEIDVPKGKLMWIQIILKAHFVSVKEIIDIICQEKEKTEMYKNEVNELKNEIDGIYKSISWKITEPLRKIKRKIIRTR